MKENNFVIISPVYNAKDYIGKCIDSIGGQTYRNFCHVVMDDCSTDGTSDIILGRWYNREDKSRLLFHRNGEKLGSPLGAFVRAIEWYSYDENDILITVDGDDWLIDDSVLAFINEVYQDDNIWLTYGSFVSESGNLDNYCREVDNPRCYRQESWVTGHLRTIRRKLFDKINPSDFRQKNGKFYNKFNDTAYMYPAIEMAGFEHSKFINKVLYVYNDKNPLCSIYNFKEAHLSADWEMKLDIMNKEPYEQLTEL